MKIELLACLGALAIASLLPAFSSGQPPACGGLNQQDCLAARAVANCNRGFQRNVNFEYCRLDGARCVNSESSLVCPFGACNPELLLAPGSFESAPLRRAANAQTNYERITVPDSIARGDASLAPACEEPRGCATLNERDCDGARFSACRSNDAIAVNYDCEWDGRSCRAVGIVSTPCDADRNERCFLGENQPARCVIMVGAEAPRAGVYAPQYPDTEIPDAIAAAPAKPSPNTAMAAVLLAILVIAGYLASAQPSSRRKPGGR